MIKRVEFVVAVVDVAVPDSSDVARLTPISLCSLIAVVTQPFVSIDCFESVDCFVSVGPEDEFERGVTSFFRGEKWRISGEADPASEALRPEISSPCDDADCARRLVDHGIVSLMERSRGSGGEFTRARRRDTLVVSADGIFFEGWNALSIFRTAEHRK